MSYTTQLFLFASDCRILTAVNYYHYACLAPVIARSFLWGFLSWSFSFLPYHVHAALITIMLAFLPLFTSLSAKKHGYGWASKGGRKNLA